MCTSHFLVFVQKLNFSPIINYRNLLNNALFQGLHTSRRWFGRRIFRLGGGFCDWNRWWCWSTRNSPTTSSVCWNDLDPDLRWSIGSIWSYRSHLPLHQINKLLWISRYTSRLPPKSPNIYAAVQSVYYFCHSHLKI